MPKKTEEQVITTKEKETILPASPEKLAPTSILTISADADIETPESIEDTNWHELQNAYRTKKILTGTLGGIEKLERDGTIAIVYYKDQRIVIPLSEMMINLKEDASSDYGELLNRQNKILGNMLGAEIDFLIKGIDNKSRSVAASRKDAMLKKRQIFYLPDANGTSRVCEGRIVQARVIAVAEKTVRTEIFGVEYSIPARDLSYDWMGDATENYHVGDQILVRITSVSISSVTDISVKADVKSVLGNTSVENLQKCKVQGKYIGTITDIHKGTVFIRLNIGVNAIAHSCYMLGAEIDFLIKGIDNKSRSVAASRKDAMLKKRQIFYLPDANGTSRVCEGRIVQARVIAVAEKTVRTEIFGVEYSIPARDLSYDWMGDATENYHVGDQILVRITSVSISSVTDISVKADVKSVLGNTSVENLQKCKVQGKYIGTITDIHKGTVFIRLNIGVNAIAHSCYDSRLPGKKDEVSFVVTRIDSERNVAVGLISRIVKQNI